MRTYHKDMTQPNKDEMFVFGSNLAGAHGAGSARAAYDNYGAELGVGFGPRGRTFAIPTKDWLIDFMPLDDIKGFIKQFCIYTNKSPYKFFITRVGCGLAGFSDADIAPLFKDCNVSNCSFPEEWREYLEERGPIMQDITNYQVLHNALQQYVCEIEFKKKNGDIRVMNCTLDFNRIPDEQQPTTALTKEPNQRSIAVFDTDIGEWRSFIVENVISWAQCIQMKVV